MFEITSISPCGENVLPRQIKALLRCRSVDDGLLFASSGGLGRSVWGKYNASQSRLLMILKKSSKRLPAPLGSDTESQDLVNRFVEYTLPKLLANDERLVYQMGFGGSMNMVTIDQAFAVMLIRRDDVMSLIERKNNPSSSSTTRTIGWKKRAA